MLLQQIVLVLVNRWDIHPYDKGVYNVSNHGNSAIITNARSSSYLGLYLALLIYMIGILQVIILH